MRFLSREADCRRAVSFHTAPFPQTPQKSCQDRGKREEWKWKERFGELLSSTVVCYTCFSQSHPPPPHFHLKSPSLTHPLALVDSRCAVAPVWLTYTVNRHLRARQSAGHWTSSPPAQRSVTAPPPPHHRCRGRWGKFGWWRSPERGFVDGADAEAESKTRSQETFSEGVWGRTLYHKAAEITQVTQKYYLNSNSLLVQAFIKCADYRSLH